MNRISQWHFFISGATQNRQQSTGLQGLWLASQAGAKKGVCFFPVLPWNYDWYTLARFVQINSQKTKEGWEGGKIPFTLKINIYAYSWGAGWGAVQLAQYLQSTAQYDVQNMVLADPVYCSTNPFLRWNSLFCSRFSLTRKFAPRIQIPSNTKNVYWSRQYNNWPRAHSLYSLPGSITDIHSPFLEKSLIHSKMDDSDWFQKKVSHLVSLGGRLQLNA